MNKLTSWINKNDYDYFRPKRLLGPISITNLYSTKYNKNIWFFGDVHIKAARCNVSKYEIIKFADLVKKELDRNQNKLIDIFIETKYITEEGEFIISSEEQSSYLGEIIQQFENCLQLDKTACAHKNARFHYVDIRQKQDKPSMLFDFLSVIVLNLSSPDNLDEAYENYRELIKLFDYSLNAVYDVINNFNFMNYIKQSKIVKQIENIDDKDVVEKLFNHISKLIIEAEVTKDKIKLIFNKIVKDMDTQNTNYDYEFYKLNKKIFYINSELVDMYMIARMFRKFKELPGKINIPAHNIIVYAGDAHVQRCVNFLVNNLGFKVLEEEYSNKEMSNFQCVDISKIYFPLFKL